MAAKTATWFVQAIVCRCVSEFTGVGATQRVGGRLRGTKKSHRPATLGIRSDGQRPLCGEGVCSLVNVDSPIDIPKPTVYGANREYLSDSDELYAHYLLCTRTTNN